MNDLHIRTERKTIYIHIYIQTCLWLCKHHEPFWIVFAFPASIWQWVLQRATCFLPYIFTDLKKAFGWEVHGNGIQRSPFIITCIPLQGANISPWCLAYLKMIFLFFQLGYVNSLEGRYIQLSYLSFSNWPLTKVSFTFQCNFSPRHGARGEMIFFWKSAAAKAKIFHGKNDIKGIMSLVAFLQPFCSEQFQPSHDSSDSESWTTPSDVNFTCLSFPMFSWKNLGNIICPICSTRFKPSKGCCWLFGAMGEPLSTTPDRSWGIGP